jgi:hypothetical protein
MGEARGWLPDDVAIIPAGLDLAAAVADVDRSSLCDEDLIRLAQARQRLAAHVQAQLLADLHAIGQRTDTVLCDTEQERQDWAETEIAMAMRWTARRAGGQLWLAEQLVGRLPAVFAALDAGEIDVPKAMVFSDETINLDGEVARRVADQLLEQAAGLTTGQLAARLRTAVLAAEPDAVRKKAKEQVKGRRVVARLTFDGLAELCGYDLPPHSGRRRRGTAHRAGPGSEGRRGQPEDGPTARRRVHRSADRSGRRRRRADHPHHPRHPQPPAHGCSRAGVHAGARPRARAGV